MAITTWRPQKAAPTLAQSFAIDPALLQSRAAQEARRRGLLVVKSQALREAERLLGWGQLLGLVIIFVSALHIWESTSAIAPASVAPLRLPDWVYHFAALCFTVAIDAIALYVSRANGVVALAGGPRNPWAAYFYALTALLNAAFVAGHAPALDAAVRAQILGLLNAAFVALLPASVAAGMIAISASRRALTVCRLALLEEVAVLRELIAAPAGRTGVSRAGPDESGHNAPPSIVAPAGEGAEAGAAAPLSGGRKAEYELDDLLAAFRPAEGAARVFGPADVRAALGCSETTAKRLIGAACASGQLTRVNRGGYVVWAGEADMTDHA